MEDKSNEIDQLRKENTDYRARIFMALYLGSGFVAYELARFLPEDWRGVVFGAGWIVAIITLYRTRG